MSPPMRRSFRILPALLGLLLGACDGKSTPLPTIKPRPTPEIARRYFGRPPDGKLHVYFMDVDQGDATLIVSPSGKTVLVDAGPPTASAHLANRLPELLTDKLDLVVLTHPHLDHYGGLSAALGAVGARKLLEPQLSGAAPDYDALLASLGSTVERVSPAPPGPGSEPLRVPLGEDTELTVLWPRAPTDALLAGEQMHELNSIVLRLTYKNTSVLLAGDAREQTELKLLERQAPLESTVLKVAAHGSFIASSAAFLKAVNPRAAVISTGAGTPERAPAKDVLARLDNLRTRVFRTDRDGEVHAVSDGQRFILTPQRRPPGTPLSSVEVLGQEPAAPAPPATENTPESPPPGAPGTAPAPKTERPSTSGAPFVVNRKTGKSFHRADCPTARRMKDEQRLTFTTRAEATAQGYTPAQDCKP